MCTLAASVLTTWRRRALDGAPLGLIVLRNDPGGEKAALVLTPIVSPP